MLRLRNISTLVRSARPLLRIPSAQAVKHPGPAGVRPTVGSAVAPVHRFYSQIAETLQERGMSTLADKLFKR